jgi:NAD(P)-dependent dehydrogenase (short-subunit alcohol dehydrogenase family)
MVVTLITGPRTGTGLATTVLPGRAGHDVYATMRRPDRASQLQTIAKQDDLPITILPLDVDDDDSVGKAVQHLLASYAIPYLACRHVG